MHVRRQIREAVADELNNLPLTGENVFQSRVHSYESSILPCITVMTNEEEVETDTLTLSSRKISRTLTITIEIRAKANDYLDDDLDDIAADIETALSNTTLSGLVKDLYLSSIRVALDFETEKPVGVMTLEYVGVYRTTDQDPETAI